ncbi:hypothetical protein [Pseudomonas lundensis]|uniref:hypothetical protein n=1 Tax=Pseudomonas lundensis TaxID=86185 RepID=UPI001472AD34|nr:hypothetical protein [Pseudomonas lundensis]NNA30638.1 hypothetical protein [Pseudomonas lundensis]
MQVTAKQRGYYGGGIKEVGETFAIDKQEHLGSWMQPGKELAKHIEQKYTGYMAARGAAGKYLVKDAAGQVVGAFTGSKAEMEVVAANLNAGGEIDKQEHLGLQGDDGGNATEDAGGNGQPDA